MRLKPISNLNWLKFNNMDAKKWYESKTIWIAIIQGIIGILITFSTQYPNCGELLMAKSIIDSLLRLLSDKPIG